MRPEEWEYDTVFFEGHIRRSGGSLVITVPTELKNRFLIKEGQKVKIIGLIKKEPYAEGGFLVYFGRFKIYEDIRGIKAKIKLPPEGEAELIDEIHDFFSIKYQATNILIENIEDNEYLIETYFGSITDSGVIIREEDLIEKVLDDFNKFAKKKGFEIIDINEVEDKVVWRSIDPSVIKRYVFSIPENIKFEWEIP